MYCDTNISEICAQFCIINIFHELWKYPVCHFHLIDNEVLLCIPKFMVGWVRPHLVNDGQLWSHRDSWLLTCSNKSKTLLCVEDRRALLWILKLTILHFLFYDGLFIYIAKVDLHREKDISSELGSLKLEATNSIQCCHASGRNPITGGITQLQVKRKLELGAPALRSRHSG